MKCAKSGFKHVLLNALTQRSLKKHRRHKRVNDAQPDNCRPEQEVDLSASNVGVKEQSHKIEEVRVNSLTRLSVSLSVGRISCQKQVVG